MESEVMMALSNRNISALMALCEEIHRLLVDSPHKVQWRAALIFSLIYTWTNGWANNRDASDLRRHSVRYDVTLMSRCRMKRQKNILTLNFDLPARYVYITWRESNLVIIVPADDLAPNNSWSSQIFFEVALDINGSVSMVWTGWLTNFPLEIPGHFVSWLWRQIRLYWNAEASIHLWVKWYDLCACVFGTISFLAGSGLQQKRQSAAGMALCTQNASIARGFAQQRHSNAEFCWFRWLVWRFSTNNWVSVDPWWRHQMETFSTLLAICAGNSRRIPRTKASGQMFSLICVWINGWVNNREAGDLRRYRAHYDVIVMLRCISAPATMIE